MCEDYFGFLNYSESIYFGEESICPVEDYTEGIKWIEKYRNSDGFIYPPMSRWVRVNPDTLEKEEEIPNTERPASLYQLPSSHKICLSHPTNKDIRKADGAFLVHLLAYLFDTRLQFDNWWFDSRVSLGRKEDRIFGGKVFTHPVLVDFLDHSYCKWKEWKSERQNLMTNLLFMFSRAPSYEWDWERFTIEYMVFDGLYKLVEDLPGFQKATTHKRRFKSICNKFKIKYEEDEKSEIKRIYNLRNDLFHEARWDGGAPGMDNANSNAIYQVGNLRRFNSRLIPAILGYTNEYVSTPWGSWSSFRFGRKI